MHVGWCHDAHSLLHLHHTCCDINSDLQENEWEELFQCLTFPLKDKSSVTFPQCGELLSTAGTPLSLPTIPCPMNCTIHFCLNHRLTHFLSAQNHRECFYFLVHVTEEMLRSQLLLTHSWVPAVMVGKSSGIWTKELRRYPPLPYKIPYISSFS